MQFISGPTWPGTRKCPGRSWGYLRATGYRVQQVSIDEAFLDITPVGSFNAARDLAVQLKQEIRDRVGITCSLGIAPSKIVAKIASDYQKT